MKGFISFIREQGVMGLAVGFLLGGTVTRVVQSLVNDIINPVIGIIGNIKSLENATLKVGKSEIAYGNFISVLIDFLIIAAVVYFVVKGLKLDKLDVKKDAPKK